MNIYRRKQRWKLILLLCAMAIGVSSLWYTNNLVAKLQQEEIKKLELWAKATKKIYTADPAEDFSFEVDVIASNTTIPVILTDTLDNIKLFRNLDSTRAAKSPEYVKQMLELMKKEHPPLVISYPIDSEGLIINSDYIYYSESVLLTKLRYYPLVQLGVIAIFLLVSYLAFSSSRRAEQNQVWVGMAKETAHQLGTPISSLMAWTEYLRAKDVPEVVPELEKDIQRLNTITERFSKIGSAPVLYKEDLCEVLNTSVKYMQSRSSSKVKFTMEIPEHPVWVLLNIPLFDWVIENLCKNAIDAMNGVGSIHVSLTEQEDKVIIDIKDSGKGIHKSKFKTIFKPGYTSKSRGWGLGLTLAHRIINEYHSGMIFVKESEIDKGTTFRIILNWALD